MLTKITSDRSELIYGTDIPKWIHYWMQNGFIIGHTKYSILFSCQQKFIINVNALVLVKHRGTPLTGNPRPTRPHLPHFKKSNQKSKSIHAHPGLLDYMYITNSESGRSSPIVCQRTCARRESMAMNLSLYPTLPLSSLYFCVKLLPPYLLSPAISLPHALSLSLSHSLFI